jgi:DMSO/TMAO reductase YedYZ heme-binding membrane subunit
MRRGEKEIVGRKVSLCHCVVGQISHLDWPGEETKPLGKRPIITIFIIIIIIIIILVITCMQAIYNYMHETNHVSTVYSVAAVLYLQYVLHVMLFRP